MRLKIGLFVFAMWKKINRISNDGREMNEFIWETELTEKNCFPFFSSKNIENQFPLNIQRVFSHKSKFF